MMREKFTHYSKLPLKSKPFSKNISYSSNVNGKSSARNKTVLAEKRTQVADTFASRN